MNSIIKEDRYIKTMVEGNRNKYWYIRMFSDFTVQTEFGRVGSKGSISDKKFDSEAKAEKFYKSKVASKLKGKKDEIPYQKLKVLNDTIKFNSGDVSIESIVDEQIQTNSPDTKELIQYFITKNIHNITENTAITYNKQTGLFETPCGPVTKEGIDEARELLTCISKWISSPNRDDRKFELLVSEYLMLIPSKVGRKLNPNDVFGSINDVLNQESILDSLEATYQTIMESISNHKEDDSEVISKPKMFDVELNLVTDEDVISHIKQLYNDTKNSMHSCHNMKVNRVFSVKIGCMVERFENTGSKVGNIKELWHGTRDGNILSILKNGLIIPSDAAGHRTGDMFGRGIYFSDQSTKSLNYSYGFWSNSRNSSNICYMFLADVAMGNSFLPRTSDWQLHKKILKDNTYNSTFAEGGKAGVRNNEMIIYKTDQANLKYLVEFTSK